ncbi:MAG: ribonuclease III [Alphaproteobacteria bacterium]|nr:ribonuclease III [Alphaproteobacteria bacterium]
MFDYKREQDGSIAVSQRLTSASADERSEFIPVACSIKEINMQKLQQTLGYTYKTQKLLKQALTHSSYTSDIHKNYERLEFLGDRILGVTIADMLCQTFVDEPEGSLARRFTQLVCKETVADVALKLGLDKYIITANPEIRTQVNVLCDVGEAIIASIYLDSKDMQIAQDFIKKYWLPLLNVNSEPVKDYKSMLQEYSLSIKLSLPCYELLEKTGLEHSPTFVVKAIVDKYSASGTGKNKKQAEQNAAHNLLKLMGASNV